VKRGETYHTLALTSQLPLPLPLALLLLPQLILLMRFGLLAAVLVVCNPKANPSQHTSWTVRETLPRGGEGGFVGGGQETYVVPTPCLRRGLYSCGRTSRGVVRSGLRRELLRGG